MRPLQALFLCLFLALFFATPSLQAVAPVATTGTATNETITTAMLRGTVNPKGLVTTAWFEWGTTTNYDQASPRIAIGNGTVAVAFTRAISNLTAATTYHFRIAGSNVSGTTRGADATFTTLSIPLPPTVFTAIPTNITTNSATLRGTVNPNDLASLVYFEWGPTTNYGLTTAPQALAAGAVPLPVQADLSSLTQDTTYHFRIAGSNVIGTTRGADASFTTLSIPLPPTVFTASPTNITTHSATLRGTVNPNGLACAVYFEWGPTTNYGLSTVAQSLAAGVVALPVQADLSALTPDAAYHCRVVASNSEVTSYGNDLTFITLAPSTVATLAATDLKPTSVTLNATATLHGLETSAWFEWGPTASYGQVTPMQNLGSSSSVTNVSAPLTGLSPQTAYHGRAVIFSGGVTNFGADVALITVPMPTNTVVTNCLTDDVRGAIERGGTVTFACDGVVVLTSQIEVANDVRIDATGHSVVLSGGNSNRIFAVQTNASLALIHLTIANGFKRGSNGLTIEHAPAAAYNGESVSGGALTVTSASLSAYDCVFTNNGLRAGAAGTQVLLPHYANLPGSAWGGAIAADASSIMLSNCVFAGNYGFAGEGPLLENRFRFAPGSAFGGAIAANGGELILAGCRLTNNLAGGEGGGGGVWCQATNFQVIDSFFATNTAQAGGAIFDRSARSWISNCTFTANAAVGAPYLRYGHGVVPAHGGAYYHGAGTAEVHGGSFAFNAASGAVAGLGQNNVLYASAGLGGGLAHLGGSLILSRSWLASNWAKGGSNNSFYPAGEGRGGAVYLTTNAAMTNCTLVMNRAIGGELVTYNTGYSTSRGFGGALCVESNATVAVQFCTLAGNSAQTKATADMAQGGGVFQSNGLVLCGNSILFQNTANATNFANVFGTIADAGHNISSDATATWTSGTSLNNTDPLLLPLADNGGPTPTMALGMGSPALNTADCAAAPATDQRGFPRPAGPGCDIGAYEGEAGFTVQIIRGPTMLVRAPVAETGRSYRLDACVNFGDWTTIATKTAVDGQVTFSVTMPPTTRFFRITAE